MTRPQLLVGLEYARVLWRHRLIAVVVLVATTGTALLWAMRAPTFFEATSVLLISPSKLADRATAAQPAAIRALLENRQVAARVLSELRLDQPPYSLSPEGFVRGHLIVEEIPNASLMQVTVRLTDSRLAAAAANRMAEGAVELNQRLNSAETISVRDFIGRQRDEALRQLREAETRLVGFQRSAQVDLQRQHAESLLEQRRQLVALELDIKSEEARIGALDERLARQARVLEVPRSPASDAAVWDLVRSRQEQSAREQAPSQAPTGSPIDSKAVLTQPAPGSAPSRPVAESERAEPTEKDQKDQSDPRPDSFRQTPVWSLPSGRAPAQAAPVTPSPDSLAGTQPFINPVYQALDYDVSASRSRLSALRSRRAQAVEALAGARPEAGVLGRLYENQTELRQLQLQYDLAENAYVKISNQHEQARIQVASRTSELQVLDRAVVPDAPVAPRRLWSVMLGLIAGVLAGIAAAFAAEYVSQATRQSGAGA